MTIKEYEDWDADSFDNKENYYCPVKVENSKTANDNSLRMRYRKFYPYVVSPLCDKKFELPGLPCMYFCNVASCLLRIFQEFEQVDVVHPHVAYRCCQV